MEIRWELEQSAYPTKQAVVRESERLRIGENESLREVE